MIIEGKFFFPLKPYVVTPHLNHLSETVQMRGHNICFQSELTKIDPNYHQIVPLIYWSSGVNDEKTWRCPIYLKQWRT